MHLYLHIYRCRGIIIILDKVPIGNTVVSVREKQKIVKIYGIVYTLSTLLLLKMSWKNYNESNYESTYLQT